MNHSPIIKNADTLGIISSVLCLIHCLALPVLVSVQPLMFEYISEDLHALEYAFLIVSFVAVYFATRRASFAVKISFYLVLSLFMIGTAFGESLPWLHYLGYAGSAGLVTTHIVNIRQHQCRVHRVGILKKG